MLQEISEDSKCEQSQAQTASSSPQGVDGGIHHDNNSNRANHRSPSSQVVGLSPAELESLNELISIDHVYVKPQPVNLQRGKEGQHKSTVHSPGNGSIVSSQQKYSICVPGSKRRYTCEVIREPISQTQPHISLHKSDIELSGADYDLSSPSLSQSQSLLSSQQFNVPDDFISLLSDSDMETSLNLFQDLDFSLTESGIAADAIQTNDIESINIKHDMSSSEEGPENDLNPTQLFDEIYQHYINIKDSSSPDPTSLSDSGVSSDFDAMSPQSSEESLHDDMWHDTSFTDLFPDLQ